MPVFQNSLLLFKVRGEMQTDRFPLAIIIASMAASPITIIMAFLAIGPGHGSLFLAKLFYPYYWLIDSVFGFVPMPYRLLLFMQAVFQFPLYGLILALASEKGLVLRVLVILMIVHGLAVAPLFIFPNHF
jgi:hypothetical protein